MGFIAAVSMVETDVKNAFGQMLAGKTPGARDSSYVKQLLSQGGIRCKELASDMEMVFGENTVPAQLEKGAKIPECTEMWVRALWIINAGCILFAALGKELGKAMAALPAGSQELNIRLTNNIWKGVQDELQNVVGELQLGGLFFKSESVDNIRLRFRQNCMNLPDPVFGEDESADKYPTLWDNMDISKCHKALVGRVSFLYISLPVAGRVLYHKVIKAYGRDGQRAITLLDRAKPELAGQTSILEAEYGMAGYGEGGTSNLPRRVHHACCLSNIVVAMLKGLENGITNARADAPALNTVWEGCPAPVFRGENAGAIVMEEIIRVAVSQMINEASHPITGEWNLEIPGKGLTSPADIRSDKSDGIGFLTNQLKMEHSTYRMPKVGAPQRTWEDWFGKIKGLNTMFTQLPDKVVIASLVGPIKTDDRRIFGWNDLVLEQSASATDPTLSQFLAHVRKQVLSNNTTRRAAAHELQALKDQYSGYSDCMELQTKIKQLWQQLYPPEQDGVPLELEPITRLLALRTVHHFLATLFARGNARLPMVRAWKNYTVFNAATLFAEFVDDELHTSPQVTEALCTQYLTKVLGMLGTAHRMYTQLDNDTRAGFDPNLNLQQNASRMSTTPQVLAAWVNAQDGAGTERSLQRRRLNEDGQASGQASPAGRGRSTSRGRGRDGARGGGRGGGGRGSGGRGSGGRGSAAAGRRNADPDKLKRALANVPSDCNLEKMRSLATPPLSVKKRSDLEIAVIAGGCVICGEDHRHTECWSVTSHPQLKGKAMVAFKEIMYPTDK